MFAAQDDDSSFAAAFAQRRIRSLYLLTIQYSIHLLSLFSSETRALLAHERIGIMADYHQQLLWFGEESNLFKNDQ